MNLEQLQKAVPEVTSVAEDGLLHEGLHRRRHVPDGLRRKEGHRFDGDVRGARLHEAGRRVEAHRVGDQAVDGLDAELARRRSRRKATFSSAVCPKRPPVERVWLKSGRLRAITRTVGEAR